MAYLNFYAGLVLGTIFGILLSALLHMTSEWREKK